MGLGTKDKVITDPRELLPEEYDEQKDLLDSVKSLFGSDGICSQILDGKIYVVSAELMYGSGGTKGMDGAIEAYKTAGKLEALIDFKKSVEMLFEKDEEEENG